MEVLRAIGARLVALVLQTLVEPFHVKTKEVHYARDHAPGRTPAATSPPEPGRQALPVHHEVTGAR
jgi:hypothetical protein